MSTGRNDPCPCGSGKKYKHCCLVNTATAAPVEPDVIAAQRKAHEWLIARFGKSRQQEIVDDYFGIVLEFADDYLADEEYNEDDFDDEDDDARTMSRFVNSLSEGDHYTLNIGLNDYTLHEAEYTRRGNVARGIELVLQAGDIKLTAPQRVFLQATAPSRLRLYEVTAVERDRGLWLRDLLRPDESACFAHEIAATHSAETGWIIGARLITYNDRLELGGALYPISLIGALEILLDVCNFPDALRDATINATDIEHHPTHRSFAELIRDSWLFDRVHPPYLRTLPTAPVPIRKDIYDVLDRDALYAVLDACAAVKSLPMASGWVYLPGAENVDISELLIFHPHDDNRESILTRILLSTRNEAAADAARLWFENIAGAQVRYREREHTDLGGEDRFRAPKPAPAEPDTDGLAPQQLYAQTQLRYAAEYADWCDAPLEILDERTPRAMLGTALDQLRVRLLLRAYDEFESALAKHEKRTAVSFDFLRQQLGLQDGD